MFRIIKFDRICYTGKGINPDGSEFSFSATWAFGPPLSVWHKGLQRWLSATEIEWEAGSL